jgi:hypothetical protein
MDVMAGLGEITQSFRLNVGRLCLDRKSALSSVEELICWVVAPKVLD